MMETPPPSGRLIAPVWTQWPLSPRLTRDTGAPSEISRQHERSVGGGGSPPASTKPETEKSREQMRLWQLRLLSPVPVEQKHESLQRTRHPESFTWLSKTSHYNEWIGLETSAVMCCYGPPGCGKTVLTSNVVDALLSSESEDFEVGYYYCDYADKVSLEPAVILGALVQALLQGYEIPDEISDLIATHYRDGERTAEVSDVFQILLQTVYWCQSVYLVVDGIDEVDEADRYTILRCLKTLLSCPGISVKVFISSRDDKDVIPVLSPLPETCFRVSVPDSATSRAIYCYVRDSVESMVYARQLAINPGNLELKNEVIQKLRAGARGIFLWVKLQLETMCLAGHEDGIRAILQDLPKDLDETYDRLLRRLALSSSQLLIRRMFQCLVAARRPLSMEELCEGMAFTIDDNRWDSKKIPLNDLDVIGTYGGLVVFDEKTRYLQLAHYTLQQYLLRERPNGYYQLNIKEANEHLGALCIAYLSFDDFKIPLAPNGNMMASPISPLDSADPQKEVSSITIGFRQSFSSPPSFDKFCLLRYARRNWLWHAARFTPSENSIKRDILFQNLVTQKHLPFDFKPWPANTFLGNPYPNLVGWAIVNNNPTLIKSLTGFDPMFNFKNYIKNSANWVFGTAIENCLSSQQQEAIAYSQDTWNENFPMHGWMYSKMLIACRRGNLAILDLCRPDLDKEERSWTQFRAHMILEAAAANQKRILDSFSLAQGRLDHCRSFTVEFAGQLCNALERAALAGHTNTVRRLGRVGWSASNIFGAEPTAGINALNNAILSNNIDVVEALLVALEITIYDPSQPTSQNDSRLGIKTSAFSKAVCSGNVAVVKIFLEDGASAVAPDNTGMCPYMQAIKEGKTNVFALLFPLEGCGIEENESGLPISMAAANGRLEIVDFFISKGANVFPNKGPGHRVLGLENGSSTTSPTPLYAAAVNGHYEVAEKLLAAGSGPDVISPRDLVQPSKGSGSKIPQRLYAPEQEPPASGIIQLHQRPLAGAALNGHFRVAQLLLRAQASVNPTDLSEISPLLLSLIGGHADVANLLSSKGAEIRNRDSAEQALLACAMGQGGPNSLQLLIEHGISPDCTNFMGESSLHIATTAGLTDTMKELIEAGADINIRDQMGQTPLMRACNNQDYRASWILVTSGANLSAKDQAGNAALSWASVSGNPHIVQLLLDNGASPNVANLVRQTPLLEACLAGDEPIVKLLVASGANIHARTGQSIQHNGKRVPRGFTPLMVATIINEPAVIGTLCASANKGVEDIEFEQRRTSLLLAAENGKLAAFHALVKGGASLKARSAAGMSALDLAVRGSNIEILEYLVAIQKRELKTRNVGPFTPEEFTAAISIMPRTGLLPGEILLKLRKLGVVTEIERKSEECIPIIDPMDDLYGW